MKEIIEQLEKATTKLLKAENYLGYAAAQEEYFQEGYESALEIKVQALQEHTEIMHKLRTALDNLGQADQ